MGKLTWYKRDPKAALDGMLHMTLEETGAYSKMLDLLYSMDGRVPDDPAFIIRWLNCDSRIWKRLRGRLIELGKLYEQEGFLRNVRVDRDVATCLATLLARAEAGRSGGLKSHKNNELAEANGKVIKNKTLDKKESKKDSCSNGHHPAPPTDPPPANVRQLFPDQPATKPNGHQPAEPTSSSGKPDGDFDRFYAAYPRKVGKGQAKKAYATATKRKANPAEIMAGLARAVAKWADDGTEGQYIPYPATWLNGEHWADDPTPMLFQKRAVADYRERYPEIPG